MLLHRLQKDHHVTDQDTDDDEDQGQAMGDVMNPLRLEELEEIHVSLVHSLQI